MKWRCNSCLEWYNGKYGGPKILACVFYGVIGKPPNDRLIAIIPYCNKCI